MSDFKRKQKRITANNREYNSQLSLHNQVAVVSGAFEDPSDVGATLFTRAKMRALECDPEEADTS